MTNQDDKQVAEAIKDKPDMLAWFPETIPSSGGKLRWTPRPFITAPTCCMDLIVLEWVQEQPAEVQLLFSEKLLEIIWGGIPQHEVGEQLHEFVRFYKVGDYASALLEVLRASGKEM